MGTLTFPSLERRLLKVIREEAEAEPVQDWPPESLQMALAILRGAHERTAQLVTMLDTRLARGDEARSFSHGAKQVLDVSDEQLGQIRGILESLASGEDAGTRSLAAELHLLEQKTQAFRDLLAEVYAVASKPPVPVDWDRLKQEADADFEAGRFTTFGSDDEMRSGLAGGD